MSCEPIRWQDVKGLPEGARVQNNKQAKVTSAFFPYYFWDPKTKGPKQERDYIGSVKDGVFVPKEALQKPPLPSRMEQKCSVRLFLTTPECAVFLPIQ
jgi:hypothetical protein